MTAVWVVVVIVVCIYAPSLWARHVLDRYDRDEYFSGNGYDLARLLLDEAGMAHVPVEQTAVGDHYDPLARTVRLNPRYCGRRSLTAVVVAAHEVGHAIQDATGYPLLALRTRLVLLAQTVERIGVGIIMAAPLITALIRVPAPGALMLAGGLLGLVTPLVVHVITLPVEWDASFSRAIPFLVKGTYIPEEDQGPARTILTACALTYVATSLAGLLNVWRWLRILRH